MEKELQELRAFKDYIMKLHGQGLSVENWHLNGALEPLDNFIDSALEREQEAAAAITEPPFILVNEVAGLNYHRQGIAGRLVWEAQQADGTFKGALEYLENLTESIIEYDDNHDGDAWHLPAWSIRKEAGNIIERQFMDEMERHKAKNIWKEVKRHDGQTV